MHVGEDEREAQTHRHTDTNIEAREIGWQKEKSTKICQRSLVALRDAIRKSDPIAQVCKNHVCI